MTHRTVMGLFSGALLATLVLGCGSDDNPTAPGPSLEVSPLFTGILEGFTVQLTATFNDQVVPVTWASNNTAAATVSATGLVTGVGGGFAAVTATMTSDPTKLRSASITVTSPPTLVSGVAVTGIASSGTRGSTLLYKIIVPAGATNLRVTLDGGSGDVDLYTRQGTPPTTEEGPPPGFTCRSWNGGNAELCNHPNPTAGTWFVLLDLYDPYAGVTLTGTVTP